VLAWSVAAVVLGGLALWGVTERGAGQTTAQRPAPLPAMVTAPVTAPSTPSSPSPARQRQRSGRKTAAATGHRTLRQPSTAPATRPASTPAAHRSASPRTTAPAVLVRYLVDGVSGAAFQGEVDVVNNGRKPLAGWQIVIALEGDEVTAVQNASGITSNGILLMQPAASTEVVPPDGGTLRVFFAAHGPRTIPLACAFNGIDCQLAAIGTFCRS
jgi:eukaryotic-like serine/threonine-protein kinase